MSFLLRSGLFPHRVGVLLSAALLGPVAAGSVALEGHRFAARAAVAPALAGPGYVLFRSAGSGLERQFAAGLHRSDLRVIALKDLNSAEAKRYRILETPTLLQLDEAGSVSARVTGTDAITKALTPAVCKAHFPRSAARLRWIEESDPRAAQVYRHFHGAAVPDIFKAMSLRPELMNRMEDISERAHFRAGYLDRSTKERIATLVSSLNRSSYCTVSHSEGLRDLGVGSAQVAALSHGDLDSVTLSPKQRALLEYVKRLTLKPGDINDSDIERLRSAGWRDEQIFEAAFDASLFAFFNRMAVTYGLEP